MTDITAKLADALRNLLDAEEEYGDPDNVAINQVWSAGKSALAAYESERVGWQPIETAPKNECVLVLAHKQQFVAWLQDDATDPWLCGAGEESGLDGMWCVTDNKLGPFPLRGGRPTHWMPLPAAPVQP